MKSFPISRTYTTYNADIDMLQIELDECEAEHLIELLDDDAADMCGHLEENLSDIGHSTPDDIGRKSIESNIALERDWLERSARIRKKLSDAKGADVLKNFQDDLLHSQVPNDPEIEKATIEHFNELL